MSSRPAVDLTTMPKPGDLVAGRYRVERVLGSGGMGFVLAARDESTGDDVALKLLHNVSDTKAIDRFFREARAMGQLESNHVVRVRDSGFADDKSPYLVMDRLDGHDLSQRAKKGPLPLQEAADYVIQACEALSHAHAKGIIHRDVKPSNLFLHVDPGSGKTIVKMLDFGISKVHARDVWERTLTATADGGVLGSPPYMSPEQVRDPRAVDSRSDVWSLGILLYRLLSGTVPYDGESVGEVFAKILEKPVPSIRVTTDVPEAIDRILAHCLTKDREQRCAHVGELALALAPFASKEIAALAPSIATRVHDEMPTLDNKSSEKPPAMGGAGKNEPRTLTVDGPPGARLSSIPPPAAARASSIPPPPALPKGMAVTSATPPPLATGGELSLDVQPPRKGRTWVAALLAVVGIAGGLAIGLSVKGSGPTNGAAATATGAATATATATATAPATGAATASATASALATGSGAATEAATAMVAPPATTHATGGRKPGGRKPTTPPAAPATTGGGAASPPATTARPELQPSPYPTP